MDKRTESKEIEEILPDYIITIRDRYTLCLSIRHKINTIHEMIDKEIHKKLIYRAIYDRVVGNKWNKVVKPNFVDNASMSQLQLAVSICDDILNGVLSLDVCLQASLNYRPTVYRVL